MHLIDYRNGSKFLDSYACANSLNEEQSDQGLHCLSFPLHLLDSFLYGRVTLFEL